MDFVTAWDRLLEKLSGWLDSLILSLPNLAVALVTLGIFVVLGSLAGRAVERMLGRTQLQVTARQLFSRITRFAFLLLGLVLALSALNLGGAVTSLLAGAGVVGLALGFAFQDLATNFIAGVGLSLRRPLQTGDIVKHGDTMGTIEEIDLRTTRVRTFEGQIVLIPNKQIYQEKVTIFTHDRRRRVDLEIGVSYAADLAQVERVTREALEGVPDRLDERPPDVYFTGFGDSAILLVARFWIPFERQTQFLQARHEAVMRVKRAYDDAGITIPFPIRTLDFGIQGGVRLDEVMERAS